MASEKEVACIRMAREAELAVLKENVVSFENEFPNYFFGKRTVEWEKTVLGRIKQIVLLPFAMVLVLVMVVLNAFLYIYELWEVHRKKQQLKK